MNPTELDRLGIDAERICKQAKTLQAATDRLMRAYMLAHPGHLQDALSEAFCNPESQALAGRVLAGVDAATIREGIRLLKRMERAVDDYVSRAPERFRYEFEELAYRYMGEAA